ncbi:hypothetical protein SIID45300_01659 [Candidatus Magnetaquicoccaceae bacterium FCR-1]|uniref:Uncharacterized protein n=1 Tax=Candidatus Magnetaquiglobus chichijimensis TaxID=3141448 RepID=A0ABQ0C8X0_9PROT
MNQTSATFDRPTWADSRNTTSLPESEDGPMPCGSPDGRMIDLFGLDRVPVSRSPMPENDSGQKTDAICGRNFCVSSASVVLQSLLESRLQAVLPMPGLDLYSMTWKPRILPSGRSISRLQASVRRTSDSGHSGWVSPTSQDGTRGTQPARPWDSGIPLSQQAAAWATPSARDYRHPNRRPYSERGGGKKGE